MKKLLSVLVSGVLFLPATSFAAINNLNGLTAGTQTFATSTASTSPHLIVRSSGSVHTFKWDGTPWLLSQGGTGAVSFATSSIPFINNGVFSENNLQFFWNAVNNILNVGGTTTPAAKLQIRGSSGLGILNLGMTDGSSAVYVSESGNLGIGTTSPSERLDVVGNGRFSGALQPNTLTVASTSTFSGPVAIGNTNPQTALDISGALYSRLITASADINWAAGNVQSLTLSSNPTLTFANGQAGGEYKLILNQDSTGGRTVTWPSSIKWPNGTKPTLSSAANAVDMASFVFDGAYYLGSVLSNFTSPSVTAQVLIVAGGGAGGGLSSKAMGGGGAGGMVTGNVIISAPQSYTITVGSGGIPAGGLGNGGNGGDSSALGLTATGGGGGGLSNSNGNGGGSAGGSGADGPSNTQGIAGQGNAGGFGFDNGNYGGGGGGGAGAAGGSGGQNAGGSGGNGLSSSISGTSVTYAGGGGGGPTISGTGGAGGGGSYPSGNGAANTGGGGAAGNNGADGGAGGSGIVIISYPTGSLTASGGTVTTAGDNTIHTFTSSGTFTVTAIN